MHSQQQVNQNPAARMMKDSEIEWIGMIPNEWEVVRVKNLFRATKRIVGDAADKYERLALTLNGVIKRSKEDSEGLQPEKFEGYQILKENELVFKLIDLENLRTSRVGLSPYTGLVSPAYIVLTNDSKDNRFPYYYFMSMYYRAIFNSLGGDGVRSALNKLDLLNIPYVYPPLHEQQAIANYLDEQVGKIDKLISEQKQAIENWKAYKQSLITETVTKGLNPDVEMKDSGIEWIGEIPKEWELKKGKYLFKQSMKKGGDHLIQLASTQAYGVVPQSFLENVVKVSLDTDLSKFKEVKINDFVISLRSFQGGFEMAKYNGVITPAYTVFRSNTCIHHNYFKYLFKAPSFISKINSITVGIREGKDIKYNDFSQMLLPIPPLYEQQAIADYLDEKCSKIDKTIEQKQQLIKQLEGYKQSLIYECVTGKRCVL